MANNRVFWIVGILVVLVLGFILVRNPDALNIAGSEERMVLDFCNTVEQCNKIAKENGATDAQIQQADVQCNSNGICTSKADRVEEDIR